MSVKEIRSALAVLQDDPETESAWGELSSVGSAEAKEALPLLQAAREAHASRREYHAVERLLGIEAKLAGDVPAAVGLLRERSRVLSEELLDEAEARLVQEEILKISPGDDDAEEAIEASDAKRQKWNDLVVRYLEEAESTQGETFRSSLLARAAEVALGVGVPALQSQKKAKKKVEALLRETTDRLTRALELDPSNLRAVKLHERLLRSKGDFPQVAKFLEAFAATDAELEDRVAALLRLVRIARKELRDRDLAIRSAERVLELAPRRREAASILVDLLTEAEDWERLVRVYERQIEMGGLEREREAGTLLQAAMVHWKMRGRPADAERYFDRLRAIDPAHPGVLSFFREHLRSEPARLLGLLAEAARARPEDTELAEEVRRLQDHDANVQKTMDQWRAVLVKDPGHLIAREQLRRLYRQGNEHVLLLDLLKGDLELLAGDQVGRLRTLREMADVLRTHLRNEPFLAQVLSEITLLDRTDTVVLRELHGFYQSAGRLRDLVEVEVRLADAEQDPETRITWLLSAAKRSMADLGDYEAAQLAFEKIVALEPRHPEATEHLRELYTKMHAYGSRMTLISGMLAGEERLDVRRELLHEMVLLVQERPELGEQTEEVQRRVLADSAADLQSMTVLQQIAERRKDDRALAQVLERKAELEAGESLLGTLQELGLLYSERLSRPKDAIRVFQRVLEHSPGHAKAQRILRELYFAEGSYASIVGLYERAADWPSMGEALVMAAEKAVGLVEKVELLARAADVFENKVGSKASAVRALDELLRVDPRNVAALSALAKMEESEGNISRAASLYESLFEEEADRGKKLELLSKLSLFASASGDRTLALSHARRTFEFAPERVEHLEAFEKVASAAEDLPALLASLRPVAFREDLAEEIRSRLLGRYSEIAERQGDAAGALAGYRKMLELHPDDETSFRAFDALARRERNAEDLRWAFERRIGAANTAQKIQLLSEWAEIEEETFQNPSLASQCYRRVLELVPSHGKALRSLGRVLALAGDASAALVVMEQDREQREGADRAEREIDIARLLAGALGRPLDALVCIERALDAGSSSVKASALGVLEQLLLVPETRAKAAAMLEHAYGDAGGADRQSEMLEVLLGAAKSKEDRKELLARLIDVHEKQGLAKGFAAAQRATREFPAELRFWDRLAALAQREKRQLEFVEDLAAALAAREQQPLPPASEIDLSERAATLYDEFLGAPEKAAPYLHRILSLDPTNERAFQRLKQILTTQEKWEDLEAQYRRTIDALGRTPRAADLLGEAALIAEEMRGDKSGAAKYQEQILEFVPTDDQANRSLELLYSELDRWSDLAILLERRLEQLPEPSAAGDAVAFRLARVHYTRLLAADKALHLLERVLAHEPAHRDARELTEQCLTEQTGEPRVRAAAILEHVYLALDLAGDLVRVLEVRFESASVDEKCSLAGRIATLRDARLNDGAFSAYARYIPLAPSDAAGRHRLRELGTREARLVEVADVLERAAALASAPEPKITILIELAAVLRIVGDTSRAEHVLRSLLEMAQSPVESRIEAARELAGLLRGTGRPKQFAAVLETLAELDFDQDARRDVLRELGALYERELEDVPAAISAWRHVLEIDRDDVVALSCLDRLLERSGDWKATVEVDLRLQELSGDGAERKYFMSRVARFLADKLKETHEAIAAYEAMIEEFGAELESLDPLIRLYEAAEKWPELAAALEKRQSLAESPAAELPILTRLAEVRRMLGEDDLALESYRRALTIDATHAASREGVEMLLTKEGVRGAAALLMKPLYEAEGDTERLLRTIDVLLLEEDARGVRLELLGEAVKIAEPVNTARAFEYAKQGATEAALEIEFPEWFSIVDRLALARGETQALCEFGEKLAPDVANIDHRIDLLERLAGLAEDGLADRVRAERLQLLVLDLRGNEARALVALERIYEADENAPRLREILKLRQEGVEHETDRIDLMLKEARVCRDKLRDSAAAIAVYEEILDLRPDKRAFAPLGLLYDSVGQYGDLASLLDRQLGLDLPKAEQAELRTRLGTVVATHLDDLDGAFSQIEAALDLVPGHEAAIQVLERWMQDPRSALRAASMLDDVYSVQQDYARVLTTLEVRIKAVEDADERCALLARLAKIQEEKQQDLRGALETNARLLSERVSDEHTWAELERLAGAVQGEDRLAAIYAHELEKVSTDEQATADLSRRTARLLETQGDLDRALVFYRRAYAFAPDDDATAFEAVDRILASQGKHEERGAHLRAHLTHLHDVDAKVLKLHVIADLEEQHLKNNARAMQAHREVLALDDRNEGSADALTRLLTHAEKFDDLAVHLRWRAETSDDKHREARFRLELGKVLESRKGELEAAVEEYARAIELVGQRDDTGASAVSALEAMLVVRTARARVAEVLREVYTERDDWSGLVRLNKARLEIVDRDEERAGLYRENARLLEEKGKNSEAALEALRDACLADPTDGDTRSELERLGGICHRWDEVAACLEEGLRRVEEADAREILTSLARIHDKRRDDPRRALSAWARLSDLDPTESEPLEQMDQLATLLSDWPTLIKVLQKKAEAAASDEERASLWRRIGEARRDMLDDRLGAIEAYERALELEPESGFTIDCLLPLFQGGTSSEDAGRFIALAKKRVETLDSEDRDARVALLLDAAQMFDTRLNSIVDATAELREARALLPERLDVVRKLGDLLRRSHAWDELLETLRVEASLAAPEEKLDVVRRIGDLLVDELHDPEGARDAYFSILDQGHEAHAVQSLLKIAEAREDLRGSICDRLDAIFERDGHAAERLKALELRLTVETSSVEQVRLLQKMSEIAEAGTGSLADALGYVLRALHIDPSVGDVHDRATKLATGVGASGWESYRARIEEEICAGTGPVLLSLLRRHADLAETKAGDDRAAARSFERILELEGSDVEALVALDRLYERSGDQVKLAEILERRIPLLEDEADRARVLCRLGAIQLKEFKEVGRGLQSLARALELAPEEPEGSALLEEFLRGQTDQAEASFQHAFEALLRVYRASKNAAGVARIYTLRLERCRTDHERLRARSELAGVLERDLEDLRGAQMELETLLVEDPTNGAALENLERLAGLNDSWASAAEALKKGVVRSELVSSSRAERWLLIGEWSRDRLRDVSEAERAFEEARRVDPESAAALAALETMQRGPGRERDLILTLRGRARVEGPSRRKEILRETVELAKRLGDAELTEECVRDVLREDDADLWGYELLTQLRRDAGDVAEVTRILLRRADLTKEEGDARILRCEGAELLEKLGRVDEAIEIYEKLLVRDRADRDLVPRLRRLFTKAERIEDLKRLIADAASHAPSIAEKAEYEVELAGVEKASGRLPEAVDALERVLAADPSHSVANETLPELLEQLGRFERLAELLDAQRAQASERGDREQEVTALRKLAVVVDRELGDDERALRAYESLFEKVSEDVEVKQAVLRIALKVGNLERAAAACESLLLLAMGSEAINWSLKVAELAQQLGDSDREERALRRGLAEDPTESRLREALELLLRRTENWTKLAAHYSQGADLLERAHPEDMVPVERTTVVPGGRVSRVPSVSSIPAGRSVPPLASVPPPEVPDALSRVVQLLRKVAEVHRVQRQVAADAIGPLEKAAALVPFDREVLLELCDVYTSAGRERDAASVLEKIIALFGTKRSRDLAQVHHRLGKIRLSLGEREGAIAEFDRAFKIDPGSTAVLRDLGSLSYEMGDLDRAQKTLRALLLQKLDANSGITKGEVFYFLGEICAKQGDKAKAIQMLERSIENDASLEKAKSRLAELKV